MFAPQVLIGMEHHASAAVETLTGMVLAVLLALVGRFGIQFKTSVNVPQASNGTELLVLLLVPLEW